MASDDVKALVARLRADAHLPGVAPATALQAADALEAERGHIQSLAKWVGVDESEGSLGIACEVSAALEAVQRPPVRCKDCGLTLAEQMTASTCTPVSEVVASSRGPELNYDGLVEAIATELDPRLLDPRRWYHEHERQFCLSKFAAPLHGAFRSQAFAQWVADQAAPPVSPEVREELARALCAADEQTLGYERRYPEPDYSDPRWEEPWVGYLVIADALLARFSFSSSPVYDIEKVAQWLFGLRYHSSHWLDAKESERDEYRRSAAALIAALPSLAVATPGGSES